jgi:hypothetical protein
LRAHQRTNSGEYDELAVIPQAQLSHFVDKLGAQLVSVSRMLLSLM